MAESGITSGRGSECGVYHLVITSQRYHGRVDFHLQHVCSGHTLAPKKAKTNKAIFNKGFLESRDIAILPPYYLYWQVYSIYSAAPIWHVLLPTNFSRWERSESITREYRAVMLVSSFDANSIVMYANMCIQFEK